MKFTDFLNQKYFEWQQAEKQRKTMGEFADYLGIKQSTVSMWYSGQNPSLENIKKLAAKLGFEVYDVLALPRPDENLAYITQHWDVVPPEERVKFREEVEKLFEKHGSKRIHKNRRAHESS